MNDSRPYKSATHGLARIEMRAVGNFSRIARSAGSDITASPTQLVARIRMFEKSKMEVLDCDFTGNSHTSANLGSFRRKPAYRTSLDGLNSRARTLNTLKRVGTTTHGYYSKNKPKALYLHLPSTKGWGTIPWISLLKTSQRPVPA